MRPSQAEAETTVAINKCMHSLNCCADAYTFGNGIFRPLIQGMPGSFHAFFKKSSLWCDTWRWMISSAGHNILQIQYMRIIGRHLRLTCLKLWGWANGFGSGLSGRLKTLQRIAPLSQNWRSRLPGMCYCRVVSLARKSKQVHGWWVLHWFYPRCPYLHAFQLVTTIPHLCKLLNLLFCTCNIWDLSGRALSPFWQCRSRSSKFLLEETESQTKLTNFRGQEQTTGFQLKLLKMKALFLANTVRDLQYCWQDSPLMIDMTILAHVPLVKNTGFSGW